MEKAKESNQRLALARSLFEAMSEEELQGLWLCRHDGHHECPNDRDAIVSDLTEAVCQMELADDMTARQLARLLAS